MDLVLEYLNPDVSWKTAESHDAYDGIWLEVGHNCGLATQESIAIRHMLGTKAREWYVKDRMRIARDERHPDHGKVLAGIEEEKALQSATEVDWENLHIKFQEGSMELFFAIHKGFTRGLRKVRESAQQEQRNAATEVALGADPAFGQFKDTLKWHTQALGAAFHHRGVARTKLSVAKLLKGSEEDLEASEEIFKALTRFTIR